MQPSKRSKLLPAIDGSRTVVLHKPANVDVKDSNLPALDSSQEGADDHCEAPWQMASCRSTFF